jgi:hypothetical protein
MLTGIIAPIPYIIARTLATQGLAVSPVRAKQPLTPKARAPKAHSRDIQVPREIYLLIVGGMRKAPACVQRRVRGLWANLASKSQRRNDCLNYTAWQFSIFIECGDLDREIAAKLLWLACEANGYSKDRRDVVKEVIARVIGLGEWRPASAKKRSQRRTNK